MANKYYCYFINYNVFEILMPKTNHCLLHKTKKKVTLYILVVQDSRDVISLACVTWTSGGKNESHLSWQHGDQHLKAFG